MKPRPWLLPMIAVAGMIMAAAGFTLLMRASSAKFTLVEDKDGKIPVPDFPMKNTHQCKYGKQMLQTWKEKLGGQTIEYGLISMQGNEVHIELVGEKDSQLLIYPTEPTDDKNMHYMFYQTKYGDYNYALPGFFPQSEKNYFVEQKDRKDADHVYLFSQPWLLNRDAEVQLRIPCVNDSPSGKIDFLKCEKDQFVFTTDNLRFMDQKIMGVTLNTEDQTVVFKLRDESQKIWTLVYPLRVTETSEKSFEISDDVAFPATRLFYQDEYVSDEKKQRRYVAQQTFEISQFDWNILLHQCSPDGAPVYIIAFARDFSVPHCQDGKLVALQSGYSKFSDENENPEYIDRTRDPKTIFRLGEPSRGDFVIVMEYIDEYGNMENWKIHVKMSAMEQEETDPILRSLLAKQSFSIHEEYMIWANQDNNKWTELNRVLLCTPSDWEKIKKILACDN